jgi:hypothetical protein
MRYWKNGFYSMPIEESVEITDEYWQELLNGQSQGKRIVTNEEGYPIISDPPAQSQEELSKREIATLKAYLSSTDYIYVKCLELGLDVNTEYAGTVQKRKDARTRIQELQQ